MLVDIMPLGSLPISMEKMTNNESCTSGGAHSVVALVYDGLCTFEYGLAAEVFGLPRPELGRKLYEFSSVAMEPAPMKAAGGLVFKATGTLAQLKSAHTIVIPGWRGKDEPVPESICNQLRNAHKRGSRILAICSGGYVLAAAGLLKNKRATTHWRYVEHFRNQFPDTDVLENDLYVDEGNIITSAGSSAGIDACLHLVRCDYGLKIANTVARRLVMHSFRLGGQTQFIAQPMLKLGEDQRLAELMDSIRTNLSEQYQITTLAKLVGMSPRTFQRRFLAFTGVTVMKWLTQERVYRSSQLLESTDYSIEKICQEVGFGSPDILRYHYREMYEVSPSQYRKSFAGRKAS